MMRKSSWSLARTQPHTRPLPPKPGQPTLDDLDSIRAAVERCYGTAPAASRPLSPAAFERLRKAIAPEFRVYEPLRLGVGGEVDALDRLTRQQLDILQSFEGPSRAVVRGVAGSGKTLLAVARARAFAAAGARTLFTCLQRGASGLDRRETCEAAASRPASPQPAFTASPPASAAAPASRSSPRQAMRETGGTRPRRT